MHANVLVITHGHFPAVFDDRSYLAHHQSNIAHVHCRNDATSLDTVFTFRYAHSIRLPVIQFSSSDALHMYMKGSV